MRSAGRRGARRRDPLGPARCIGGGVGGRSSSRRPRHRHSRRRVGLRRAARRRQTPTSRPTSTCSRPGATTETPAAALAAYMLWSATVAPEGIITRESVLMSKHWMDKLWTWDHCFNAMALAPGRTDARPGPVPPPVRPPGRAGALPDSVTHSEVLYNYVKPPIHGWALQRLRATASRALTIDELELIHDRLARWTGSGSTSRRAPGHALPYYQHGNDSGWDNSTTFDRRPGHRVARPRGLPRAPARRRSPTSPDELGRPPKRWRGSARRCCRAPSGPAVDPARSSSRSVPCPDAASTTTSLLNLLPLVLGERLPARRPAVMADRLAGHLTEYGLATEPVDSRTTRTTATGAVPSGRRRPPSSRMVCEPSGSPTSPTWSAPDSGRCASAPASPRTSTPLRSGLRDRAYTWTASVYLSMCAAQASRAARSQAAHPGTAPGGSKPQRPPQVPAPR